MKSKIFSWKNFHKWIGVIMALFLIVFCVSGIILNHRAFFSGFDVPRCILPSDYQVKNFNNGVVKGTIALEDGQIVAYGNGVWLTERTGATWKDWSLGFPKGVDNRSVRNMVRTKDGALWCVTNFAVYRHNGGQWIDQKLEHYGERLTDLALSPDSTYVVALSRDAVYEMKSSGNVRKEMKASINFEPKDYLFRTVWKLHSGEIFGIVGRLVVDAIAIVLIILCATGIVLFILPYNIKWNRKKEKKESCRRGAKRMVWNQKWHNRFGFYALVFTLFITITGTCLRPPLMIPLILGKTSPVNFSDNVWQDRLRAFRWDAVQNEWLISTSDGFLCVDRNFENQPIKIMGKTPMVSPMGVNVFRQQMDNTWLIGSFSGLFIWNRQNGTITDFFGEKPKSGFSAMFSGHTVTGYSEDFEVKTLGNGLVFEYSTGAEELPAQPEVITNVPMSLWHLGLELHVGRCYSPFLGPLSSLFVFIWGTLSVLVIVSGYIVYHRQKKRRNGRTTEVSFPQEKKQEES